MEAKSTNTIDAGDFGEVYSPKAAHLCPAHIADGGKVRQGGLHHLLPWFFRLVVGS